MFPACHQTAKSSQLLWPSGIWPPSNINTTPANPDPPPTSWAMTGIFFNGLSIVRGQRFIKTSLRSPIYGEMYICIVVSNHIWCRIFSDLFRAGFHLTRKVLSHILHLGSMSCLLQCPRKFSFIQKPSIASGTTDPDYWALLTRVISLISNLRQEITWTKPPLPLLLFVTLCKKEPQGRHLATWFSHLQIFSTFANVFSFLLIFSLLQMFLVFANIDQLLQILFHFDIFFKFFCKYFFHFCKCF